jgi:hypothetical protein
MVEKHLANEGLPEDFSEEIQRLLNFGNGSICLLRRWGKLTPEQKQQAENDAHIAVRNAATPRG